MENPMTRSQNFDQSDAYRELIQLVIDHGPDTFHTVSEAPDRPHWPSS